MFWPSPDDAAEGVVVVVCPVRQYTEDSFDVQKDLGRMESEPVDEDMATRQQLNEVFMPEIPLYSTANCCDDVPIQTSSNLANTCALRHRRTWCRHHVYPR